MQILDYCTNVCFRHLPKIYQSCMMSATMSSDVKALKRMVLHNAVCKYVHACNVFCIAQ